MSVFGKDTLRFSEYLLQTNVKLSVIPGKYWGGGRSAVNLFDAVISGGWDVCQVEESKPRSFTKCVQNNIMSCWNV
jgi:hypothetical protein